MCREQGNIAENTHRGLFPEGLGQLKFNNDDMVTIEKSKNTQLILVKSGEKKILCKQKDM